MKLKIDKDYRNAGLVAIALTALSYLIGIALGWITGIVWLEAFAVITSYACVWLCDHQRRFQYIIGAITTTAYCVLFWQSALVASAIVNAYLAIQLVYGWFRWRPDEITRPVTRLKLREVPGYLLATAALFAGAYALTTAFGGAMVALDVAILCGNVLAQWMLDNKKLENWAVWAAVNVLSIIVYARAGLPLVALQYVAFLANTVYGWVKWSRSRVPTSPLTVALTADTVKFQAAIDRAADEFKRMATQVADVAQETNAKLDANYLNSKNWQDLQESIS